MPTKRSPLSVAFLNSNSLHHPHFPRNLSFHSHLMSRHSRLTLRISGLGLLKTCQSSNKSGGYAPTMIRNYPTRVCSALMGMPRRTTSMYCAPSR